MELYHYKKGGGGGGRTSFSHAEGGLGGAQQVLGVVLTQELEVLVILIWGGGGEVQEGVGGAKGFTLPWGWGGGGGRVKQF